MKYQFYFGYSDEDIDRFYILAKSFEVVGGAARNLNVNSVDDISITSEFEQARQFKNITIYMLPTAGSEDMEVALELSNYATKKTSFLFGFHVRKLSKGKVIEELNLVDSNAIIKNPPRVTVNSLLMIEVWLPSARISDAKYGRKGWISTVDL